ncbi:bifunctional MaoC family dehydratase N-terminal/OB-fold nucleic acid binding domain-containing protein [Lentzea sp. HUAS12]|uniref:bifunctional MaoC family dehydratase N-terminal/OB-fold nucleic acid binding domain-containing protein n=1 Tax=Lentzea sp. HUAS12 TaxID=2951806 RepID=UPI0020A0844E|nr:OB-fold domain-containing protein [Lentzea sp. HUAS12]USX56639.1 OB-fold domain-containing protein [Lentzea sp. HUAS12]
MDIEKEAARIAEQGECAPRLARDPVNQPMINNWLEALGDEHPGYDGVAPPAMVQVWTMAGLHGQRTLDDPLGQMMTILDEAGYTSVVATNSDQTYHRYLEVGEHLSVTTSLEDVTGPKRTGLGEGWFVTTRSTWWVGDEAVAEMRFRVLKFKPAQKPGPRPEAPKAQAIRPSVNRDTEYFWEGTRQHELRIQRCGGCGLLRHPPGPMCPECGATKPKYLVSDGNGVIYSYVVHHHPQVPGRQTPFVIALVELDEGVRVLGEFDGEPSIGQRVEVVFTKVDEELTMPSWRPRADR